MSREYRQHRFAAPPGSADLLVVRHGESEPARLDAPHPTLAGRADPPLDPRGRDEADLVAKRLHDARIASIYVSPLRRTAQTAAPLADRLGLSPAVDPDLAEVHLGEWEGATFRQRIIDHDPVAMRMFTEERWDVIPGAEPLDSLQQRVRGALTRIAEAHPDQRVLIVTHGGVIGSIMSLATGSRPFAFLGADNASVTHIVVTESRWIVRRFNDTSHLTTDLDRRGIGR